MTHTVVELPLSANAYAEIASKLCAAGYGHCFGIGNDQGRIDMTGIRLVQDVPEDVPANQPLTPLQMIAEWRKGCSNAPTGRPAECTDCTVALIDALERRLLVDHVSTRPDSSAQESFPSVDEAIETYEDQAAPLPPIPEEGGIWTIGERRVSEAEGAEALSQRLQGPREASFEFRDVAARLPTIEPICEHQCIPGQCTVVGCGNAVGNAMRDSAKGPSPEYPHTLPGELLAFGRVRLANGQIVGEVELPPDDLELVQLRKLRDDVDDVIRLVGVPGVIDKIPEERGAALALSVSKIYSECAELRELKREVIAALDHSHNAIRVREGGGPENLGQSIAATVAKLDLEVDRFRMEMLGIDPFEAAELRSRLPRVREDFVEDIKRLPRAELQRRVMIQSDWIGSYARCLDDVDLTIHGKQMAGSGVEGARDPRNIRAIVNGLRNEIGDLHGQLQVIVAEKDQLQALIDSPQIEDFLEAIKLEAAHQRKRWGTDHDAGKTDVDWLFLAGYLGGKAVEAGKLIEKTSASVSENVLARRRLHHIVAAGAAVLNWHAARIGISSALRMRPGIEPPEGEET